MACALAESVILMEPSTNPMHDAQLARAAAAKAMVDACLALGTASIKSASAGKHVAVKTMTRTLSWKRHQPATSTPMQTNKLLVDFATSPFGHQPSLLIVCNSPPAPPPRASAIRKAVHPLRRRSSVEEPIQKSEPELPPPASAVRDVIRRTNAGQSSRLGLSRLSLDDHVPRFSVPPSAEAVRQVMKPLYAVEKVADEKMADLPPSADTIRHATLQSPAPKQPEALVGVVVRRASVTLAPPPWRDRRHQRRYVS